MFVCVGVGVIVCVNVDDIIMCDDDVEIGVCVCDVFVRYGEVFMVMFDVDDDGV